jgi:hypothetical protein
MAMKTASLLTALSAALALNAVAQSEEVLPYTATSRSAHETVWQRVEWSTNSLGRAVARTNELVEIATGLNHLSDETPPEWQPSREEWVAYPDGIVALTGRHKVILAPPNLTLGGCVEVDVLLPDGVSRLVSSPVSLGFYDPVDGKQLVLAEVKADCKPERGAAMNEIVFRSCFDHIRGSIRFLYTKSGVHQHVVLEQRLELSPGFSDKSRLECYTVFAPNTPAPQIQTRVLRREKDPVLRALMVEPDFTDSQISFGGEMAMQAGKAFSLGDEAEESAIRVGKQWTEIGGLPVLIEAVEFQPLEPLLEGLASVVRPNSGGLAVNSSRQIKRAKEQARLPQQHYRAFAKEQEIQLARHPLSPPAVVLDYELLGSGTNLVLKGGTTWFVSGLVNVTNLVIEGTAVVKVTNSPSAKIVVHGTVDCQTGPYRPAIFTSQYDTSVGESIGSGTLTNYPGALVINTSGKVLRDLRISHATNGVALGFSGGQIGLTNVQFVSCKHAVDFDGNSEDTVHVRNGLFWGVTNVLNSGYDNFLRGAHLTVNQCNKLFKIGNGNHNGEVYLTNSILANLAALGDADAFDGSHNGFYNSLVFGSSWLTNTSNPFQTVGVGAHYLSATNFRDAGTPVGPALLVALPKKTAYPPVELTTNFTGDTTLTLQAPRDTSPFDLGFHYDPIDFTISSAVLSNATLILTNGVVLGTRPGANANPGILYLRGSGKLISEGLPQQPNVLARYLSVQEGRATNVNNEDFVYVDSNATAPEIRCRFTDWRAPSGSGEHLTIYNVTAPFSFRDGQFSGSSFFVKGTPVALTNCLWERVSVNLNDDEEAVDRFLFNNQFKGGSLTLVRNGTGVTEVKDTLFDATTISQTGTITHDYNGYVTNQNRLSPNGAHDVLLPSALYASGALGNFYQTADFSLNNVGSRDAYTAGLFHYTTKTSQVMETNSVVDIGFHYMALNAASPWDIDFDLIPDYADPDSDSNDGLPDWWEQKYMGHLNETPGSDFDGDCLTNLFEYQQGSNPADQPGVASAPVYQIVPIGANASFSVTMTQACLSYQWYHGSTAIAGATNTSLTLPAQQQATNVLYKVVASSRAGAASPAARLVVFDGPAWTIWTNFLAHTNNKTINMWATNYHPIKTNTPILAWATNSLLYGWTSFTAISPANSFQGKYAPVTALTRRHGYTAGHALTTDTNYAGFGGHTNQTIWFCTASNQVEPMTVAATYVRYVKSNGYDYAIFIFTKDLTNAITPMAVTNAPNSFGVWFRTSQYGTNSANMPPFAFTETSRPPFNEHNTFQGGDSGSPNMIPMTDGSLVFIRGTDSSGPSTQMQKDMDYLCTNDTYKLNLNITNYQLHWHTNYP